MTKILRVLIVDDEPLALDYMESMLMSVPGVQLIGRCRSGREALAELQKQDVDLMFLDIQMPGIDGLETVKCCQSDVMPVVVFATAYDEYAVKAFEANAVDYLLKPFVAERVAEAVVRARARLLSRALQSGKDSLVAAIAGLEGGAELLAGDTRDKSMRLAIKDGAHTHLVDQDSIAWVDAAGDYMCVHADGETYILRSTMKDLEKRLSSQFARIHRSTLVNVTKIIRTEALPKGECLVILNNDVHLKASRSFRGALLSRLH